MPDNSAWQRLTAVFALCALLAAGCTTGGDDTAGQAGEGSTEQATPAPAEDDDAPTDDATAEPDDDVASVPDDAPSAPLATVEGTVLGWNGAVAATLEILDLRRSGQVVTLAFAIVTAEGDRVQLHTDCPFAAEIDATEDAPVERCRSISATSLVDPVNGNRHLVLREPDGACVCTSNIPNFIEPGQRYSMGASFAAPPDDVDTMTVAVPQFAPVDVPLRG